MTGALQAITNYSSTGPAHPTTDMARPRQLLRHTVITLADILLVLEQLRMPPPALSVNKVVCLAQLARLVSSNAG
jgi:hypothetical protein